nr:hypothetical protein [uncultured Clostridium sp.]
MNCNKKASFTIKGSSLLPCSKKHVNFHLSRMNFQIIKGTVYHPDHTPCSEAVVQITQVDMATHAATPLGYAMTDKAGRYVISLEAQRDMKYELSVFAPLITDKKEDML